MPIRCILFAFCILFSARNANAQAVAQNTGLPLVLMGMGSYNDFKHSGPMSSWATLSPSAKPNMTFTINMPQPCPRRYTNVISNTNLFSMAERKLLKHIPLEYRTVTTNSGPRGTVFVGFGTLNSPITHDLDVTVSRFEYTNSGAYVKVLFFHSRLSPRLAVSFRTKSGNGYDALFPHRGSSVNEPCLRQFKHGKLDGLWVDFKGGHCLDWLRFRHGKAVGKWLVWNEAGTLYMEAKFKRPCDLIGPISVP